MSWRQTDRCRRCDEPLRVVCHIVFASVNQLALNTGMTIVSSTGSSSDWKPSNSTRSTRVRLELADRQDLQQDSVARGKTENVVKALQAAELENQLAQNLR
jgi:hypothetical protein